MVLTLAVCLLVDCVKVLNKEDFFFLFGVVSLLSIGPQVLYEKTVMRFIPIA